MYIIRSKQAESSLVKKNRFTWSEVNVPYLLDCEIFKKTLIIKENHCFAFSLLVSFASRLFCGYPRLYWVGKNKSKIDEQFTEVLVFTQ